MNSPSLPIRLRTAALAVAAAATLVLTACGTADNSEDDPGDDDAVVADPCAGPEVTADGLKPVRFGIIPALITYPVQVAAEQGFFEEHGIDAEVLSVASPPSRIPGLCSTYDVVVVTTSETIEAAVQGADVGVVSGLVLSTTENPSGPLLSTAETGPIETPEDLVGLTLGLNAVVGATPDAVRWVLNDAGLGADAATIIAVPIPAMIDQLNAGLIDAAITAEPFITAGVQSGLVTGFDPLVEAAGSPSAYLPFAASAGWADANSDLIDGLRAAIDEAIAYIEDDPESALEGAAEWLEIPAAAVQGANFGSFSTEITREQVEAWIRILNDNGTVTETVDVEDIYFLP